MPTCLGEPRSLLGYPLVHRAVTWVSVCCATLVPLRLLSARLAVQLLLAQLKLEVLIFVRHLEMKGVALTIMAAVNDLQPSQQGAEAKVYVSEFYGRPCIIKERFVKTYRVPELDQKLTQRRISQVASLGHVIIFSNCIIVVV